MYSHHMDLIFMVIYESAHHFVSCWQKISQNSVYFGELEVDFVHEVPFMFN